MLHQTAFRIARSLNLRCPCLRQRLPIASIRNYASVDKSNPTRSRHIVWDDNVRALQAWLKSFHAKSFPKELCTVTFSRSSGPGGQNVNKLNTKAMIRMNVYEIENKLNWPPEVIDALREHRDTTKTGDVIISSERFRTQTQNLEDAWTKLFEFVKNIVELPGAPSIGSLQRREELKNIDKSRVRKWKTEHSEKKRARKGQFSRKYDDDDW